MSYNTEKVRHISHEIKNQLSVCDLYTEILERYCAKNGLEDNTILNSVACIKKALKLAGNTLLELKSSDKQKLGVYNLNEVLKETFELSKVYGETKEINIQLDSTERDINIEIDKNRFQGIIINLVKNACEAFEDEPKKEITIKPLTKGGNISIIVSNNARPVENPSKIFEEGITTKSNGSGLGLYIAKNNIEEMGGSIRLLQSNKESTQFQINVKKA